MQSIKVGCRLSRKRVRLCELFGNVVWRRPRLSAAANGRKKRRTAELRRRAAWRRGEQPHSVSVITNHVGKSNPRRAMRDGRPGDGQVRGEACNRDPWWRRLRAVSRGMRKTPWIRPRASPPSRVWTATRRVGMQKVGQARCRWKLGSRRGTSVLVDHLAGRHATARECGHGWGAR